MSYILSGHETFPCRYFWLKKGIDFQRKGHNFTQSDAVVHLGVGKNMVNSIRYWLKSFGFFKERERVLLDNLFLNNGLDQFLEDINSLWLLHYQIVKIKEASIYSLLFNDFNPRTEFSFKEFEYFLGKKFEVENFSFSTKTLESDIGVLESMYIKSRRTKKSLEDDFTGIFQDLGLFDYSLSGRIIVNSNAAKNVSSYIILYIILDRYPGISSISFNNLLNDESSLGKVFCLTQASLFEIIESLIKRFDFIVFTEDAGVRELQIKEVQFQDKIELLNDYYKPR